MARILIVEDDTALRLLMRCLLAGEGHDAVSADSGIGAVRHLERHRFDLVVTDILMPDMDGIELLQHIRRTRPDLPVIAISGFGSRVTLDFLPFAARLGADAVLRKPVSASELLAAVRQVVGGPPPAPPAPAADEPESPYLRRPLRPLEAALAEVGRAGRLSDGADGDDADPTWN